MVALAKKAQPKDWNDYRGITLLEVASKVLTNIILARMAIPMLDAQFGFRRARSTRQAVALAKHVLSSAKSAKCPAVAVFIDSEKAYDSLRHVVLWDTLRRAGVGEATIALLQDLYNGETRVKMVNTMARRLELHGGSDRAACYHRCCSTSAWTERCVRRDPTWTALTSFGATADGCKSPCWDTRTTWWCSRQRGSRHRRT
eukprot:PhF_6_TR7897/c0_g5_i5/m.11670